MRDLKARYVGSSMGFFWSVVFPIINLFVYMFVFRLVLNTRWSDSQGATEVALVMLSGIVVWSAFAETVSRATNCLVDHANLIKKVVFPSELLPVFLTVSSLVNMCIGLPVVVLTVAWLAFASPPVAHVLVQRVQTVVDRPLSPEEVAAGESEAKDWLPAKRIVVEGGEAHAIKLQLERGQFRDTVLPLEIGGTAVPGVDYEPLPDEVIIPAGHVEVSVLVRALADDIPDGDETLTLRIGEPEWATRLQTVDNDRNFETVVVFQDGMASSDALAGAAPRDVVMLSSRDSDERYYPLNLGTPLLALPLLLLLQGIFTSGLGFFLSTLNVFLRDTYHLVGVGITVWMFSTPIFYPAHMVTEAGFGWMLALNPMHWLIECYRMILLHAMWPDPILLLRFAGAGLSLFLVGATFFRAQRSKFSDLL